MRGFVVLLECLALRWALTDALKLGNVDMNAPIFDMGFKDFTFIQGPLVQSPCRHGCCSLAGLNGSIVLVEEWGCSNEDKVRRCQEAGCLGVLTTSRFQVAGYHVWSVFDGSDRSDLRVPLWEVSEKDSDIIKEQMRLGSPVVTGFPNDINEWAVMFQSTNFRVFFQGLIAASQVVLLLFALQRLKFWCAPIQRTRTYYLVPVVCLSLEVAGALFRIVLMVDPNFSQQIFPFLLAEILPTITVPWGYASTILIVLFWDEVLRNSVTKYRKARMRFILDHRNKFYAVVAVMTILDITTTSLIGTFTAVGSLYAVVALYYLTATILLSIAIVYVGYNVMRRYREDTREAVERRKSALLEAKAALERERAISESMRRAAAAQNSTSDDNEDNQDDLDSPGSDQEKHQGDLTDVAGASNATSSAPLPMRRLELPTADVLVTIDEEKTEERSRTAMSKPSKTDLAQNDQEPFPLHMRVLKLGIEINKDMEVVKIFNRAGVAACAGVAVGDRLLQLLGEDTKNKADLLEILSEFNARKVWGDTVREVILRVQRGDGTVDIVLRSHYTLPPTRSLSSPNLSTVKDHQTPSAQSLDRPADSRMSGAAGRPSDNLNIESAAVVTKTTTVDTLDAKILREGRKKVERMTNRIMASVAGMVLAAFGVLMLVLDIAGATDDRCCTSPEQYFAMWGCAYYGITITAFAQIYAL